MASQADSRNLRERSRALKEARHRLPGALRQVVAAGAEAYCRERDLPRLIGMIGITDVEPGELIGRLRKALRAERNKARSGHWTYDLNRHIALRQAYVAETERLRVG